MSSSSPPPPRLLSHSPLAPLQVPFLPLSQKFSFFFNSLFLLKVKSSRRLISRLFWLRLLAAFSSHSCQECPAWPPPPPTLSPMWPSPLHPHVWLASGFLTKWTSTHFSPLPFTICPFSPTFAELPFPVITFDNGTWQLGWMLRQLLSQVYCTDI